jgi:2-succinyl-6-hydroxy-2,4-cyclohexadiene-1-carboxylate synthase
VEPIETWTQQFVDHVACNDDQAILMGYSMGGRLALQALLAGPRVFRAAVIVSAGLGLEVAERKARRTADQQWAIRFEHDDWQSVIRDWNAQPLFAGHSSPFSRKESDFDRGALAAAMRLWSPASHEPLLPRMREIEVPVLWVAGQDDEPYALAGRRAVRELPRGELWICPASGHRVVWEHPESFVERLRDFLGTATRK